MTIVPYNHRLGKGTSPGSRRGHVEASPKNCRFTINAPGTMYSIHVRDRLQCVKGVDHMK